MTEFYIRKATPGDLHKIISIFRETILAINSKDYDPGQIRVWIQSANDEPRWMRKINEQYFICCENLKEIVGFGSIDTTGYLDLLYVHARYQGQGIATFVMKELERFAIKNHINLISSDVSITARPFFDRKGYAAIEEQKKTICGIELINYRMQKII